MSTRAPTPSPNADVRSVEYGWPHGLAEIVTPLLDAGLRLLSLREHRTLAWQAMPSMVETENGDWRLTDGVPDLPLMFTLRATND